MGRRAKCVKVCCTLKQYHNAEAIAAREQLRLIWERSQTRDVRDLLWEIHRLRAIALRSHQLQSRLLEAALITRLDPTTKMIVDGLAEALRNEPVVEEAEAARRELFRRTAN